VSVYREGLLARYISESLPRGLHQLDYYDGTDLISPLTLIEIERLSIEDATALLEGTEKALAEVDQKFPKDSLSWILGRRYAVLVMKRLPVETVGLNPLRVMDVSIRTIMDLVVHQPFLRKNSVNPSHRMPKEAVHLLMT